MRIANTPDWAISKLSKEDNNVLDNEDLSYSEDIDHTKKSSKQLAYNNSNTNSKYNHQSNNNQTDLNS